MTPGDPEPGRNAFAHNWVVMAEAADFYLRTSILTAPNFKAPQPTDF